jgi:ubiquinone/menaquinone biosynthesis C-methylase UbiE
MKIAEKEARLKNLKITFAIVLALFVTFEIYFFSSKEMKPYKGRHERGLLTMYDQDDLAASTLFVGNFINYGLWDRQLMKAPISFQQRLESEKNMYRYLLGKLTIQPTDDVLEVACGQGVGAALVWKEFHPKSIQGIDISKAQISRALKINKTILENHPNEIFFHLSSAENILFPAKIYDKVLCVQALQHFLDLEKFTKEAFRVLKDSGKLGIVGFFGTKENSSTHVAKLIPTVRDGIDHIRFIDYFRQILEEAGFQKIEIEVIGDRVWKGIDRWFAQGEFKKTWARNWYKAYRQKLLDYYLITAEKI